MSSRILHIARREILETVKTRTFLISLAVAPLITVAIIYFAGGAGEAAMSSRPDRRVVVVDRAGEMADGLRVAFDGHNKAHPERQLVLTVASIGDDGPDEAVDRAKGRLQEGQIDAVADLAAGALDGDGGMTLFTGSTVATDFVWHETVRRLVNRAAFRARCRREGLPPEQIDALRRSIAVEHIALGADKAESSQDGKSRMIAMMVSFAFMFLLYTGVMSTGQMMVTSIIEEKSSRIMEVLLAAVKPVELMTGKILGVAAVGLALVGGWALAGWAAAAWRGGDLGVGGGVLACFAVYYILGYLLIGAILAGLGSVCNTRKEAQSLLMPVVLVMIIPMVAWFNLSQDANGALARVLSYVPVTTSMVMVLRIAAGGDLWAGEIALSMILLLVWVIVAMWASGRVFRTGVLMYGKRPGLREICRWVRRS